MFINFSVQTLQFQCPKNSNFVHVLAMKISKKGPKNYFSKAEEIFSTAMTAQSAQKQKGTRLFFQFLQYFEYITLQGTYFLPPALQLCSFAYLPIHSVRSIKGSILSINNHHNLDGFYKKIMSMNGCKTISMEINDYERGGGTFILCKFFSADATIFSKRF